MARVTICTIQRLYSMLRGEELDEDIDEKSGLELAAADDRPKDVAYNPAIPIETFDFSGRNFVALDSCQVSNPAQFVQKLWNYCNIPRDDGGESQLSITSTIAIDSDPTYEPT